MTSKKNMEFRDQESLARFDLQGVRPSDANRVERVREFYSHVNVVTVKNWTAVPPNVADITNVLVSLTNDMADLEMVYELQQRNPNLNIYAFILQIDMNECARVFELDWTRIHVVNILIESYPEDYETYVNCLGKLNQASANIYHILSPYVKHDWHDPETNTQKFVIILDKNDTQREAAQLSGPLPRNLTAIDSESLEDAQQKWIDAVLPQVERGAAVRLPPNEGLESPSAAHRFPSRHVKRAKPEDKDEDVGTDKRLEKKQKLPHLWACSIS